MKVKVKLGKVREMKKNGELQREEKTKQSDS